MSRVAIEYRWAAGQYDRLPALAADLVRRQVAVIAAVSGTPSASAAKAATATIPIVFAMASDPVASGLVSSLNRPSGNVTGATFFTAALAGKRLELLRELVPKATTIALLVNPDNPPSAADGRDAQAAAQAIGLQAKVLNVSTRGEIETAFATLARERPDILYVGPDAIFFNERDLVVATGGAPCRTGDLRGSRECRSGRPDELWASRSDAYRQAGNYAGRILKGAKPGDLPVVLPAKFAMVINAKTAKALGLDVPPMLLARADEVIE